MNSRARTVVDRLVGRFRAPIRRTEQPAPLGLYGGGDVRSEIDRVATWAAKEIRQRVQRAGSPRRAFVDSFPTLAPHPALCFELRLSNESPINTSVAAVELLRRRVMESAGSFLAEACDLHEITGLDVRFCVAGPPSAIELVEKTFETEEVVLAFLHGRKVSIPLRFARRADGSLRSRTVLEDGNGAESAQLVIDAEQTDRTGVALPSDGWVFHVRAPNGAGQAPLGDAHGMPGDGRIEEGTSLSIGGLDWRFSRLPSPDVVLLEAEVAPVWLLSAGTALLVLADGTIRSESSNVGRDLALARLALDGPSVKVTAFGEASGAPQRESSSTERSVDPKDPTELLLESRGARVTVRMTPSRLVVDAFEVTVEWSAAAEVSVESSVAAELDRLELGPSRPYPCIEAAVGRSPLATLGPGAGLSTAVPRLAAGIIVLGDGAGAQTAIRNLSHDLPLVLFAAGKRFELAQTDPRALAVEAIVASDAILLLDGRLILLRSTGIGPTTVRPIRVTLARESLDAPWRRREVPRPTSTPQARQTLASPAAPTRETSSHERCEWVLEVRGHVLASDETVYLGVHDDPAAPAEPVVEAFDPSDAGPRWVRLALERGEEVRAEAVDPGLVRINGGALVPGGLLRDGDALEVGAPANADGLHRLDLHAPALRLRVGRWNDRVALWFDPPRVHVVDSAVAARGLRIGRRAASADVALASRSIGRGSPVVARFGCGEDDAVVVHTPKSLDPAGSGTPEPLRVKGGETFAIGDLLLGLARRTG